MYKNTPYFYTPFVTHLWKIQAVLENTPFRWKHTMVCSRTHHAQVWETQVGVFESTPCLVCCEAKAWRILHGKYKWYIICHHHINTLLMSVYRNMATQNIEVKLSLRYSNMDVLKILTKIWLNLLQCIKSMPSGFPVTVS